MNFREYQAVAERSANRHDIDDASEGGPPNPLRLANFGMGIAGEAGEVCDLLKKHVFHGHALEKAELAIELGDVLWYIAVIARTAGIDLDLVAFVNLAKLKDRYPNGFNKQASVERAE